jgi:septal ring factor EnvC (AmiA/AmiB activator)
MDVEKTIEFILAQQAQAEGRMEGLDRAIERLERAISQTNRTANQLVRYGVSLRSDVRRHDEAIIRLDKAMAHLAEVHAKTDGKLNALIDLVDKSIRRNGK